MQRLLPAILLLLALCGGALFFLFSTPDPATEMGEATLVPSSWELDAADSVSKAGATSEEGPIEAATSLTRSVQKDDGTLSANAGSFENASWVHARLVDQQGRAISGSSLRARKTQRFGDGDLLSEAISDANGNVRLEVPADVNLNLRSHGDFWAPQSFALAALQPGEELDLGALTMASADTLAGRVLDPKGNPVENARVDLVESGSSIMSGSSINQSAITDADGNFEIGGIPQGIYRLRAFSRGFSPAAEDPVVVNGRGETQDLDLHLGAGRTVSGVVLDENNRPVEGVVVSPNRGILGGSFFGFDDESNLKDGSGARTNAQGAFTLAGLEESMISIVVRGDGYATQRPNLPGNGVELVVHLQRSLTFSGRVIGPGGNPVADAEIRLSNSMGFGIENPMSATQNAYRSKADGSFEITGLRPGEYRINSFAPIGQLIDSPLSMKQDVIGMTVNLEAASHLVIMVSNQAGEPVAEASVAVRIAGSEGNWDDLEFNVSHTESSDEGDGEGSSTRIAALTPGFRGTTDAFGRAVIYGVPEGSYDVSVKADRYAERSVTLERVKAAQEQEVILPTASQLIVFAMTPEELVLRGVDIYLKPMDREGEVLSQTSDTTGRAVWPRLESGRYEVGYREAKPQSSGGMMFSFGGGGPKKILHPVEQVDVQGTGRTELIMKIQDLSLATVFVTRNGSPVGGVEAWLETPSRGPGPRGMDLNRPSGSTTNADGRALLEPKEPGKYILVVRAGRQAPQVRTDIELVIGTQEFEIEIPGVMVSGNLFAEGRPMVGASLSLERDTTGQENAPRTRGIAIMMVDNGDGPVMEMASGNANDASAVSDGKGDYRFVDVPAGNWVVKCRANGFERWTSAPFSVGEGKDVDLGTHRLQKGASISGADATYDPESTGRSMFGPNSLIMLRDDADAMVDICMTGPDGRYSFKDLAPGSYIVTHGDYTSEILEIHAGEQLNHDLPKE